MGLKEKRLEKGWTLKELAEKAVELRLRI